MRVKVAFDAIALLLLFLYVLSSVPFENGANLPKTARDIGIATAKHQIYSEQGRPEFEWREFAAREELIR
jgi:hypothetical protein